MLRLRTIGLCSILALFWPIRLLSYGRLTRSTPLNRPILGLLIMALVSLYPSVDLSLSLPKFWSLMLAFAMFFAIVNVRRETFAIVDRSAVDARLPELPKPSTSA